MLSKETKGKIEDGFWIIVGTLFYPPVFMSIGALICSLVAVYLVLSK